MAEKEVKKQYKSPDDYRFSFIFSINDLENKNNDIIICKRDFDINGYDSLSSSSLELKECIDDVVTLINRDLKSKSRVYTWYNYDQSYVTDEFTTQIPKEQVSTFKFTFYDGKKPIITKSWSADEYPFNVRNGVDLTNKKYKYESVNINNLEYSKQIMAKASLDKPDLTSVIMRHIISVCSSFNSKKDGRRIIHKQNLSDLALEEIVIENASENKFSTAKNKLKPINTIADEQGNVKNVYSVYSTKECSYDLKKSPQENMVEYFSKKYAKKTKAYLTLN